MVIRLLFIRLSWLSGYHGYQVIMVIGLSSFHGYQVIMVVGLSWLSGYQVVMIIGLSWLSGLSWLLGYHGYQVVMVIRLSWLSGIIEVYCWAGNIPCSEIERTKHQNFSVMLTNIADTPRCLHAGLLLIWLSNQHSFMPLLCLMYSS